MGRAWIHSIKVVMLTFRQVMRCQYPDGTYIHIREDQGVAKKMLCCSCKA